jgi:peroxiredoxin
LLGLFGYDKNSGAGTVTLLRKLLLITLALLLIAVPSAAVHRVQIGKPAPDFSLPSLGGKKVSLSEFKGKAVFLNFWATWCPPCKEEMPSMEKVYREQKGRGFEILAVSIDKGTTEIEAFKKEHGLTFTILHDPEMKVAAVYELAFVPTTYLIDRSGNVVHRETQYRDWADVESRKLLEKILK